MTQTTTEAVGKIIERLNNARAFIQDSLDNGHLSGGDVGNLMAARDEIDVATLIAIRDFAKVEPMTPFTPRLKAMEEEMSNSSSVARAESVGFAARTDRPRSAGKED